jgi:hypothetical protein
LTSPVNVGEGGFGCALLNPPPCAGDAPGTSYAGLLGKVIAVPHARPVQAGQKAAPSTLAAELATNELLADVPGRHEFTLPVIRSCDLGPRSREVAMRSCGLGPTKWAWMPPDTPLHQLIMPYGGVELAKTLDSISLSDAGRTRMDLLRAMSTFIGHLAVMHEHGVAHSDIKSRNVTYRADQNRLYLIDFGLANDRATDQMLKPTNRRAATYHYYPADLTILHEVLNKAAWSPAECEELHRLAVDPTVSADAWASKYPMTQYARLLNDASESYRNFTDLLPGADDLLGAPPPLTLRTVRAALQREARALHAAAAPPFLADQLRAAVDRLQFRKQTDVYGVGLMLLEVLGQSGRSGVPARVRERLLAIVRHIMTPARDLRPTMDEVAEKVEAVLESHVPGPSSKTDEARAAQAPGGSGGGHGRGQHTRRPRQQTRRDGRHSRRAQSQQRVLPARGALGRFLPQRQTRRPARTP